MKKGYALLDSGDGKKLERFGRYTLIRPASQAVWKPQNPSLWKNADTTFTRDESNHWSKKLSNSWEVELEGLTFKAEATDFGHVGLFPEHHRFWHWMQERGCNGLNVLNLFAYSGGATLAAARAGAEVCHVDASKGMVTWARENAALNHLENAPIRWIVDDAEKFMQREVRRGRCYDGIILDPPTFGRGARGEIFKIEEDVGQLLDLCRQLLSDRPKFILFSCHTPGFTPMVLEHLLSQHTSGLNGTIDSGEMFIEGEKDAFNLPSGCFARWSHD